jgi:hypothetical protein
MRKRVLVAGLLALAVFLAWWHWPRTQSAAPPHSVTNPSSKSEVGSPQNTKAPGASTSAQASAVPAAAKPGLKEQLREVMNSANRPISFFGKVIDQDSNPIPDVKVTFEIRYMKEVGPVGIVDTFDYPSAATGPDGRFALTGAKGSVLAVKSLEKPGYEPSEQVTRGTYWYWRDKDPYRPDADNPKLFHMWKKAGAEKLVRKGIGHAIRYDGTPSTFDLLTGSAASQGDLRVSLVRNPQLIVYGQRDYEWTATIEVPDGGVIASTAEQMYLAPVGGYQNKVIVHMPANDPQWTNLKDVAVYLKLRDGKYYGRAKLEFMVGSDRETTPFSITSFVNPSGSRNLEYDPAQNLVPDLPPRTASTPKP